MSNTRIRYKKSGPTSLKSVRVFSVNDKAFSVVLDTDMMKYSIRDENTNEEVTNGGKTKNLAVLKIQAKKALNDLGVSFGEETRNRGNSTTETERSLGSTNTESSEIVSTGSL